MFPDSVVALTPGCRGLWGSQKQRDRDAVESDKAGGGVGVIGNCGWESRDPTSPLSFSPKSSRNVLYTIGKMWCLPDTQ